MSVRRKTSAALGTARIPSAFSSLVLADAPLLYWRFGESSGTTAADSSGNSRNGTYTNSPTRGAASLVHSDTANTAMGVAADTGQCCSIASAAWMNVSTIAVECLVNFTSSVDASNGDAIASRYDGTGFNWLLWRNTTGLLAVQIRNNSGTAYNVTGPSISLSTTYQVGFSFDGSTLALYSNGSSVGSTAVTGTVQTGSAPIEVGRYSAASNTTPGATIDEFSIYTALSATRFAAHAGAAAA